MAASQPMEESESAKAAGAAAAAVSISRPGSLQAAASSQPTAARQRCPRAAVVVAAALRSITAAVNLPGPFPPAALQAPTTAGPEPFTPKPTRPHPRSLPLTTRDRGAPTPPCG